MHRHRRRLAGAALGSGAVLLLTACGGTRLPDSAFAPSTVTSGGSAGAAGGAVAPGDSSSVGSGSGAGGVAGLPGTHGDSNGGGDLALPGAGSGGGSGPTGSRQSAAGGHSVATGTTRRGGRVVKNTASDRGVTPTSITVCNVVTSGGPFGAYQFTPSYYGAAAYFAALNAAGGVNGRTIRFISHPDDGSGSDDLTQVHTCIDTDKAFAFVGNDIYQYAGASYVNSKDVPDVGAEPISTAYYEYPHLYTIDGDQLPRNGKSLGRNGSEYATDEAGLFFKEHEGIKHVGVVFYDQASSQTGAQTISQTFKTAGVKVSMYQVNLGLPNFASTVAQMKADGVDLVADAVDLNGSEKLCGAIEQNAGFEKQMKIKLSTIADWSQSLGTDLSSTPHCLAKSWADGFSANYADTSIPQVAAFNRALRRYFPSDVPHNHEFALEGYAGAMWFTAAVRSCGADVTRACVEKFMNRKASYTAGGLLSPNSGFAAAPRRYYTGTTRQCVSAAQWSVKARTWVTRASLAKDCYQARAYKYSLGAPS